MEPKKNFIKTLGIALGIIVVLLGAIWYVKGAIDEKLLVVQQLRAEMQTQGISLSGLAKLQGDAEKAKQYIPQLDRLFTNKDQLLGFSSDISFLAKQAGFSGAPQFKEESAPTSIDLQKNNFSLLLEGPKTFQNLSAFFDSVEKSKYFVRFASIDVLREGDVLRVSTSGYVLSF
jgi:hypothetical protein